MLHSFKGGKDGANPNGGLIFDGVGNIYGTTFYGGNDNGVCKGGSEGTGCGTVFEIRLPAKRNGASAEEVLFRFMGRPTDGSGPNGGLVVSSNGDLYGTTIGGGSQQYGVIFQLAPPVTGGVPWHETLIHTFSGGSDGSGTETGLVPDFPSNFYGTSTGGASHGGVLFRLGAGASDANTEIWNLAVLYDFAGTPDGYGPVSLVRTRMGTLFGTTQYGGTGQACQGGCGAVFQAKP